MWYANNHILAGVIIVLWMLSSYRVVGELNLGVQGPMLVGIPTTLAMLCVYLPSTPTRERTEGQVVRAITLVFMMGVIMLPEGFICWLMLLPIVLLVAIIAVANAKGHNTRRALLWAPLLVLSLEGTLIGDAVSPNGRVTAVEQYDLTAEQVVDRLATTPVYEEPGGVLGIGFPTPIAATGAGLEIGDTRTVEFTGGNADAPSVLEMVITERSDGRVVFTIISDTTPLANWMSLEEAEVTWVEGTTETEVSWTLRWERKVHPGVYFGPAQQVGMNAAAEYLLDSIVG